jgi:hypothetical protein
VPHPPFIYDPISRVLTPERTRSRTYQDNLCLVDRIFGELMAALDTSRPTTVIVTSDHWYRRGNPKDTRVPFAVWRSDWRIASIDYHRQCNTVFLRALVSDILSGQVTTPSSLLAWLDSHASDILPSKT